MLDVDLQWKLVSFYISTYLFIRTIYPKLFGSLGKRNNKKTQLHIKVLNKQCVL